MQSRDIILDVSRLVWRVWSDRLPTGIDRVCLAYVSYFGARALALVQLKDVRLVLSANQSDELFALLRRGGKGFRRRVSALLATATMSGVGALNRSKYYINVGHTGLDTPRLSEWLKRHNLRPIYLIHDLIPISHPRFCRVGEAHKHRRRMQTVLDSAAGVIVNSDATRRAFIEYAASLGFTPPPVQVAWLGAEAPTPTVSNRNYHRPYFVMVGTIEARKNHLLALKIWEKLAEKHGDQAPELILIGQRGWEADEVFAMLDRLRHLSGYVRELGRCDDATMWSWIAGARALLMPSFVEGFGIPVIEALMQGTPVIASDLAAFREIAGDIPRYLDPADEEGWSSAIENYCGSGEDRVRQLSALRGFQAPNWDQHFAKVGRLLASI